MAMHFNLKGYLLVANRLLATTKSVTEVYHNFTWLKKTKKQENVGKRKNTNE